MIVSRRLLPVVLLLLVPVWVRAQEPASADTGAVAPAMVGRYTYVAAGSDNVDQAIGVAVKKVSWLIRGFARGRLRKTNNVYQTIVVARTGDEWSLSFDGRKPVVAPVSGDTVPWTREDGEKFRVVIHQVAPLRLEQIYVASDGVRTNEFEWSPDGSTMAMHVKVESPKLKEPLTYTLNYERK